VNKTTLSEQPFFRPSKAALCALATVLVLAGCAKKNEGEVVARFDDMTITDKEFSAKIETLPRQLREVALRNKKRFLEDMAAERYLFREAEKRKIQNDPEVKDVLEAAHRKILIARLIETEVDKKIELAPDEASRYYESHKDEFMTPELFRASHILVKTGEEAQAVKVALDGGADFEETARKRSVDQTAIRGGDLGFFQKGQFVPEFEQAAFMMKKGETSDPVKSRFGWHIIRLTDRGEPALRDFASVKPLIEERLLNEKRSAAFHAFVDRLKGGATVKIDESALEEIGARNPASAAEAPGGAVPAAPAEAPRSAK